MADLTFSYRKRKISGNDICFLSRLAYNSGFLCKFAHKKYNMARSKITTKHIKNCNGIRIEPGMSVEVVTQTMSNPVVTNGGQNVVDAFMRIYGIDIKKAGCLNMVELDVKQM